MMSESSQSPASVRFTGPEEQQLVKYRAVHKLALVALVLGVLSAAALISPVFGLISLSGIICSVVGLRAIRANPQEWIGITPAIVGLGLSIFFLSWTLGWSATRSGRLAAQAERFANEWLELVQLKQLYAAHQLRQRYDNRVQVTGRLDDYYRTQPDLLDQFQEFSKSELLTQIASVPVGTKIESTGVADHTRSGVDESLVLQYELPATDQHPARTFYITVVRTQTTTGGEWRIDNVGDKLGE
jgi:hypothetical protein